jgi:TetR/AcrR family transcriptional regulator, ethionamide resistance regulator
MKNAAKPTSARQTKGERTRASLKAAALTLLARDGYFDLKVTDVCAEAGVASGTFYIYFEDKAALVTEVIVERIRANSRAALDGPRNEDDFLSILAANRRYIDLWAAQSNLMLALGQAMEMLPAVRSAWAEANAEVARAIAASVARRAPTSKRSMRARLFAAYAMQAMLDGLLLDYFVWRRPDVLHACGDPETLAQSVSLLWHRALYACDPDPKHVPKARDLMTLRAPIKD